MSNDIRVSADFNYEKTSITIQITASTGVLSDEPISNKSFTFTDPDTTNANPVQNKEVIRVREIVYRLIEGSSEVSEERTYDLTEVDLNQEIEIFSIAIQDERPSDFVAPKKPKQLLVKTPPTKKKIINQI